MGPEPGQLNPGALTTGKSEHECLGANVRLVFRTKVLAKRAIARRAR